MVRMFAGLLLVAFSLNSLADEPAKPAKPTKEQVAVREWLKENTNTGKWQEVRWYKPEKVTFGGDDPHYYIRLKYRTQNGAGAQVLVDDVFEFTKQGVERKNPLTSEIYADRERLFDDK